jgi:UDPglucose 6-dehydrogenase
MISGNGAVRGIAVVGLGHVGLVTAIGMAELGWQVWGTDVDEDKLAQIKDGEMPFFEPGLDDLLKSHLASGRFIPVPDVRFAIASARVVFVCVGTPQGEDGHADLSYLLSAVKEVAEKRAGDVLIVEKSTVPVLTTRFLADAVGQIEGRPGHAEVACNPEFLREGSGLSDFLDPERVVIGVQSDAAGELLLGLYSSLECPKLVTNTDTAELIKHASNSFLSTKISFINMIADLCEATDADVTLVAKGMGLDPRIGPAFLEAGLGFGGYCFPKDIRASIAVAEQHGVNADLLRAAEQVNLRRVVRFIDRVEATIGSLHGATIGVWGLAFKAGTDDVRDSPALQGVELLLERGARVQLHDPQAMGGAAEIFTPDATGVTYAQTPYDAAAGADAVVLLTEWPEYRRLDMRRLFNMMRRPVIGDGRNLLHPEEVRSFGFEYVSVGRP